MLDQERTSSGKDWSRIRTLDWEKKMVPAEEVVVDREGLQTTV